MSIVRVLHGDCLRVMRLMRARGVQVDSIVTDPPYHLSSIVKRLGKPGSAPIKDRDGLYARQARGFMGKEWDGGDIAMSPETWALAYDVLKPGGHMIALCGTRTEHRVACAIEDAGFEIRDRVLWLYGSGFPKSHDVSKGVDKTAHEQTAFDLIRAHIRHWRNARGFTNTDINRAVGSATNGCGMARHWTSTEGGQHAIPSKSQWRNLKRVLQWPDCELDEVYDTIRDGAERPTVGQIWGTRLAVAPGQGEDRGARTLDVTAPATDAARQWEGWGTALKPAVEIGVLARKPLAERNVAANVLRWGTGAINVDGTRIPTGEKLGGGNENLKPRPHTEGWDRPWMHDEAHTEAHSAKVRANVAKAESLGRFPANVIHDGSDEVVGAFPASDGQQGAVRGTEPSSPFANVYGDMPNRAGRADPRGDTGTAARFFYSAKADKTDRFGSKHPTVKPVDLMAYLTRLITPPGGVVLDPFAGSGTTGMAAIREGFRAVLIEREAEYVADIHRRLQHVRGEDTPLFQGAQVDVEDLL